MPKQFADANRSYLIELSTEQDGGYADSDVIRGKTFATTTETYSFTETTGARRTVKVMREMEPVSITQKEFVARLKKGEIFKITTDQQRRCKNCNGFGKVTATGSDRPKDGKADCPICKGKGNHPHTSYEVSW